MSKQKQDSGADFNDLLVEKGREEVARQILAAANDEPANSPEPPRSVARTSIETALKRYALVMPDAKVWDKSKRRVLKNAAFKSQVGSKVFKQWLEHDERETVEIGDIYEEMTMAADQEAAAQKEGGGGLGLALNRYVYLYPTDSVWDRDDRDVVPMSALRYAIADCFNFWLTHPYREEINRDNLVFDPTCKVDTETHINMFQGIRMKPKANAELAEPIFRLVFHLCNGDKESYKFLLDWIAYPLQFPGKKMASAVLMHSEMHGSGKSLFFEGVVKAIYGEYGATLGQHQLESQYTDWRSRKLFALFEEVFSRDQKYSHNGTIKHMITGDTHRIEKKFVSGWEESNFMNSVFLSNEIQPFPLETNDRRFLVIWPLKKLSQELKAEVVKAIEQGAIEAFYAELLNRDLSEMHTHKEPPINDAKESLIDFGRAPWDVFYRDWSLGRLPFPFTSCLVKDLFRAYQLWCAQGREHCMGQHKFSGFISSRLRRRYDVRYQKGKDVCKGSMFLVNLKDKPSDKSQEEWLGNSVAEFKQALNAEDPEDMPKGQKSFSAP